MSEKFIKKIHFRNFKGFRQKRIDRINPGMNILIGDNDSGKSSVLLAIDLVLSANPARIESIGLDHLLNQQAVDEFLKKSPREFKDLPELEIDLYLSELGQPELDGEHNIENTNSCGIYLRARPRDELYREITELISLENPAFPYEYYLVEIKGFGGQTITPYKKPLRHLGIDNTKISNDYASRSYVRTIYNAKTDEKEKNLLKYGYRLTKDKFTKKNFEDLNRRIEGNYGFSLKSDSRANLETDLTITQDGVDIESLGVGAQCFIRTEFALSKKSSLDVVLLEEPENHLSHVHMKRLIDVIKETSQSQVFVATHSSLVCSRLDLRCAILMGHLGADPVMLEGLPKSTAEYFMKAPNSLVLEFALATKTILVEGDAEYILMDSFHQDIKSSELSGSGLSVIAVGGTSFPRYLDIAKLLGTRAAVIRDNDGDVQRNCVERYEPYSTHENIKVFFDDDPNRWTFEVALYEDNRDVCDKLFGEDRKTLTVQEYMLKNKAEAAFKLSLEEPTTLSTPEYIAQAIKWASN